MPKFNAQTFQEIRQLPLEVSFEQVEIWVRQQAPVQLQKRTWLSVFLAYFFQSDN